MPDMNANHYPVPFKFIIRIFIQTIAKINDLNLRCNYNQVMNFKEFIKMPHFHLNFLLIHNPFVY